MEGLPFWEEFNNGETDCLLQSVADIPDISVIEEHDSVPKVEVQFLNLTEDMCFEKVQSRRGGTARQVLENAVVQMRATYGPQQLLRIYGWIRRAPEAAKLINDQNQEVLLCESPGQPLNLAGKSQIADLAYDSRYTSINFSVDLGKVYEGPKQPVFQLAKTDTAARNRFQLLVQLEFLPNERSEIFVSPTFLCRTKPKRVRSDVEDPHESPPIKSLPTSVHSSSSSGPPSVGNSWSPGLPACGSLILDSLTARTAKIDDLVATNCRIESEHADIAYHLKIKDAEVGEELEEGDIVGFYTDESEEGETYIKPLCSDDIDCAVHAGVVSRSYYLAANKTNDYESATDTVCVIGIVNVKVIGTVENGERIYASIDRPGKAVPQSHLPVGSFLRKKHVLLGMALERKLSKTLDESNLVKCFVCIVLDVGRKDLLEEVEHVYLTTEKSTEERVKRASKKTWRKLKCYFLILFIMACLLSVILYQLFAGGSWYHYWQCRRHCSKNNLDFNFFPDADIHAKYHVHGIQCSINVLEDKVPDAFDVNNLTGGVTYYFLNLDRCAYRWKKGHTWNGKLVGGGSILSINSNCTTVYYHGYNLKRGTAFRWWPYKSASNLTCRPRPPYDTT